MSNHHESLGNYILTEKIGTGGMAEVFLAHHKKQPQKRFALKRMLTKFSQNKELVNMFIQEASLASILNHPNIIPIYDFGVIDNQYFLAMEYVEGKDLKSILRACIIQKKTLPLALSVHIACQTLHALHYAHNKCDHYQRPLQIVHRDISPQNIMISYDGSVKILDFGIAKAIAKPGEEDKGMLKGKFSYMSPEQASGRSVDPRSDVFAVGIVLWELLTLHSCYTANEPMELIKKVREAKIVPPHVINQKISPELSQIVMKALQKNLQPRYQNALEFGQDLENFLYNRYGSINPADMISFLSTVFYEPRLSEILNTTLKDNTSYVSFKQFQNREQTRFNSSKHAQSSKLKKLSPWRIHPSMIQKYLSPTLVLLMYCLAGGLIYKNYPHLQQTLSSPPAWMTQLSQKITTKFLNTKPVGTDKQFNLSGPQTSILAQHSVLIDAIAKNQSISIRNRPILQISQALLPIAQDPKRYFANKNQLHKRVGSYHLTLQWEDKKPRTSLRLVSIEKTN